MIEELILQEEELGQEPLSKKLMLEQLLELGPARGCDLYFAQIFPLTFALGKNENWEAYEGKNMDSPSDGLSYQLEEFPHTDKVKNLDFRLLCDECTNRTQSRLFSLGMKLHKAQRICEEDSQISHHI